MLLPTYRIPTVLHMVPQMLIFSFKKIYLNSDNSKVHTEDAQISTDISVVYS